MVGVEDAVGHGEAEAAAAGLGGEKRFAEQAAATRRRPAPNRCRTPRSRRTAPAAASPYRSGSRRRLGGRCGRRRRRPRRPAWRRGRFPGGRRGPGATGPRPPRPAAGRRRRRRGQEKPPPSAARRAASSATTTAGSQGWHAPGLAAREQAQHLRELGPVLGAALQFAQVAAQVGVGRQLQRQTEIAKADDAGQHVAVVVGEAGDDARRRFQVFLTLGPFQPLGPARLFFRAVGQPGERVPGQGQGGGLGVGPGGPCGRALPARAAGQGGRRSAPRSPAGAAPVRAPARPAPRARSTRAASPAASAQGKPSPAGRRASTFPEVNKARPAPEAAKASARCRSRPSSPGPSAGPRQSRP